MTGYVRNDTANNIADGNVIDAADLDGEFDAIQAGFNSSTGHTHDGTTGEGAPITKIGPVQDVVASATALYPKTTNTVDLGTSSLKYKDVFITGTATLPTVSATTIGATTGNITTVNATTVDTTNIEVTNIKAKDGTASASIADSTGVMTIASSVLTTADINGGTIDSATIGATTPASGAFTTLTTSSTVTHNGGTANGVAYLNGSKALTTGSALVFDGTNLGVGTSSPSGQLHVSGGASNANFYLSNNSYSSYYYQNTGGSSGVSFPASQAYIWDSGGSEQMRLTSTGLGIGTSSPGFKLDVNGNTRMSYGLTVQGSSLTAAASQVTLDQLNTTTSRLISWGPDASTAGILYLGTLSSNATVGSASAVIINGSGNLGLGVTPSAWGGSLGAGVLQISGSSSAAPLSFTTYNASNVASGYIASNAYYNGTNWIYNKSNYAALYEINSNAGKHLWLTAASGTAGNAISFTQAMTLDASGNLGVGTTSPAHQLDVSNGARAKYLQVTNNGYAGSAATTPELYSPASGTLAFACNGGERARITSAGDFLVGTTTKLDAGKLSVLADSTTYAITAKSVVTGNYVIEAWNNATSGDNKFILFSTEASPTTRGSITYNRGSGLTAYNATSDYRLKTVKGSIQNALSKLAELRPCTGRMNGAEFDIDFFVAHELQEVVPSAVTGEKDAVNEDGTPDYQMVDKSALIPLLTAALQEQQAIIESLTARIEALESN